MDRNYGVYYTKKRRNIFHKLFRTEPKLYFYGAYQTLEAAVIAIEHDKAFKALKPVVIKLVQIVD